MLLIAVAKSYSEKTARPNGQQAFVRLKTIVKQIILWVQPRVNARFGIIGKEYDSECAGAKNARDAADPLDASTRHENHTCTENEKNNRAGHVFFQGNGDTDESDDAGGNQNAVFECFHFRQEFGYVKRKQQHKSKLHDFGWLELNGPDFYPTSCAFCRRADPGQKNTPEKNVADAENRERHFL